MVSAPPRGALRGSLEPHGAREGRGRCMGGGGGGRTGGGRKANGGGRQLGGAPKAIAAPPGGTRLAVRLEARVRGGGRSDRPPAHDRREPPPQPRGRGDGP